MTLNPSTILEKSLPPSTYSTKCQDPSPNIVDSSNRPSTSSFGPNEYGDDSTTTNDVITPPSPLHAPTHHQSGCKFINIIKFLCLQLVSLQYG